MTLSWLRGCHGSNHVHRTNTGVALGEGTASTFSLQLQSRAGGWLRVPWGYRYRGDVGSDRGMAPARSHCISVPHRKALEMGCCIQSSLAKIVAEFEIDLEHYVLQPLNKLSEVVLAALLAPFSNLITLLPVSPGLPRSLGHSLPQEELPTILKRKKTLQKLISDWNTIKSRYGAHCRPGGPGHTKHSPQTGWGREEDNCPGDSISSSSSGAPS